MFACDETLYRVWSITYNHPHNHLIHPHNHLSLPALSWLCVCVCVCLSVCTFSLSLALSLPRSWVSSMDNSHSSQIKGGYVHTASTFIIYVICNYMQMTYYPLTGVADFLDCRINFPGFLQFHYPVIHWNRNNEIRISMFREMPLPTEARKRLPTV